MIPGEKKPLVGRPLREAFDVTEFEEIQMLTAGLSSALVFRMSCAGALTCCGIWSGEISLAGAEAKLQYARVHMNQSLQEMRSARFEAAQRTVSDKHALA